MKLKFERSSEKWPPPCRLSYLCLCTQLKSEGRSHCDVTKDALHESSKGLLPPSLSLEEDITACAGTPS